MRLVRLDLATTGHVQVRVVECQLEGAAEIVGLMMEQPAPWQLQGEDASGVTRVPPASGVPKSTIRSPTLLAHAFHSPNLDLSPAG